jgi:hypothetical protein
MLRRSILFSQREMKMRGLLASCVVAASVLVLAATDASAYYCRARSPSANGWATNNSLSRARANALYQCAIRTPRRQTCRITSCTR